MTFSVLGVKGFSSIFACVNCPRIFLGFYFLLLEWITVIWVNYFSWVRIFPLDFLYASQVLSTKSVTLFIFLFLLFVFCRKLLHGRREIPLIYWYTTRKNVFITKKDNSKDYPSNKLFRCWYLFAQERLWSYTLQNRCFVDVYCRIRLAYLGYLGS